MFTMETGDAASRATFPEDSYSPSQIIAAVLITALAVAFGFSQTIKNTIFSVKNPEGIYTLEQVNMHNTPEDCWLIVDGFVFDLTSESKKHPAMFSCGTDGSVNYHKNHGPTIRDRMMAFRIGELDEESKVRVKALTDFSSESGAAIAPVSTLFVESGTWNPLDLMIVMERDNRSLLVIDGKTNTPIGRVSDIGSLVHTQVFSPDGVFVYHISRDGWLTKIDLRTLEPVGVVRVGTDSRGTAITDSGTFIAVGNYEPREVVIVDAGSLSVVTRIALVDTMGAVTASRAGGLVERGEKFIVSLKDARSVWVIDTEKRGMPVTQQFWDIGEEGDILHDAFLTLDGNYFLTAVQGSDRVWVLDTQAWKVAAEVTGVGRTPHTGPGAMWGNTIFVPSLKQDVITAIDMRTWKVQKLIETGGAGLFVRGYPDASYRYVWADTAFGTKQDEIDIVDVETLTVIKKIVPMPEKRAVHPEFTRDGKFVYVAVWGGDKIYIYDAHTFEEVTTIDAITPTGISNVGLRIEEPGL